MCKILAVLFIVVVLNSAILLYLNTSLDIRKPTDHAMVDL